MRDIEFRGKRKDNGDWIYGFVKISPNTGRVFISVCEKDKRGDNWLVYEVIPETVGQFMELLDKNGVKIFEGDIISVADKCLKIVKYLENEAGIGLANIDDLPYEKWAGLWSHPSSLWWDVFKEEVEVIGNIFDNKELLEARE